MSRSELSGDHIHNHTRILTCCLYHPLTVDHRLVGHCSADIRGIKGLGDDTQVTGAGRADEVGVEGDRDLCMCAMCHIREARDE